MGENKRVEFTIFSKALTPYRSKTFTKSPHPVRRLKSSTTSLTSQYLANLSEEEAGEGCEETQNYQCDEQYGDEIIVDNDEVVDRETGGSISSELDELLKKADDVRLFFIINFLMR